MFISTLRNFFAFGPGGTAPGPRPTVSISVVAAKLRLALTPGASNRRGG
jgi:hypothetical protein